MNPYMVYEPQNLLGFMSSLRQLGSGVSERHQDFPPLGGFPPLGLGPVSKSKAKGAGKSKAWGSELRVFLGVCLGFGSG